ncbi:TetR/AcrR family transcriptional regulator [Nocardia sp. MDA0666]|uniref:TetR/AcrR family transcriptional regulator n=1 Tax=Nocardia sp. MDA0666 TaxID=2135448 RepID=UPI0011B20E50|nr:TetR/AcrR family transcriptional regulator [Nocardia sp. MDA0666]
MSRSDTPLHPDTAATVLQLLNGGPAQPLPRHRHTLSREDVRETQRARILAAAIELFAEPGYAPTAVQDITKRAGVSRKTFYELYETKEDVFVDAYQVVTVLAREIEAVDAELLNYDLDTLDETIRRYLLLMAFAPVATRMFFLEALGVGPRVRARRNQAIEEFVTLVAPSLQELRARNEPALAPLSVEHCRIFVAAAIELITQYLADHEPATLAELTPQITQAVYAIVVPNHTRNPTQT